MPEGHRHNSYTRVVKRDVKSLERGTAGKVRSLTSFVALSDYKCNSPVGPELLPLLGGRPLSVDEGITCQAHEAGCGAPVGAKTVVMMCGRWTSSLERPFLA